MLSTLSDKKLAIIEEIANAIIASDDISTISNLILELTINHTWAEKGSLMMVNGRHELHILCGRGLDHQLSKNYRVKIGEGIAGLVAQSGEAVLVEDIETDERFRGSKRDHYKTRSFISCPIQGKEKLLGVLNINDKKDGEPFTQDEFALVKVAAGHAALALNKAFLVKKFKDKTAEVEDVNRKLISMDVAKTDFLTRLSHELRTPLNSVKGAVYYLQKSEKNLSPAQVEFQDIIAGETDKLIAIVEKQLDFLRLEDESRIVKKSVIQLEDLLKETLKSNLVRNALARNQIRIEHDFSGPIPEIIADKILVSQMFINLIEGLAYLLRKSGSIALSVKENGQVEITLRASENLPEEVARTMFSSKHIYQPDKPEEGTKLYLAMKVAETHGWSIGAENLDEGFQVRLLIPKVSQHKVEAAMSMTLDRVLEFASEALGVNTCSLMLSDNMTGDLTIQCARGLDDEIIRRTRIKIGEQIAGWVAHEGKPLLIEDIENDPHFGHKNIDSQYRSRSLMSVPLKANGQVIGVLNLNNKKTNEPFNPLDLKASLAVAERISRFVEKINKPSTAEGDLNQMVASLDSLLDAETRYPKKSSRHVELMGDILDVLAVSEADKETGLYASLIYDLGLMLIDEKLLDKRQKLTPLETKALRSHPYTTLDLLGNIEHSDDVRKAVLHHHEKYDGTGYPDRLKGEKIPLLARVLAVVDAYCAMLEKRPYRAQLSSDEALVDIRSKAGSWYDPKVVDAFEMVMRKQ